MAEERLGFGFRFCRRDDRNRETKHVLQIFVRSLGENGVFFDTDGEIAHVVNRLGGEAAEVARARERDVDELVEEVVHPRATKRDLEADGVTFAHFEGRDRSFCRTRRRFLAGNLRKAIFNKFQLLLVALLANARRNNNLLYARALHRARVAKLFRKCEISCLLFLFGDGHTIILR